MTAHEPIPQGTLDILILTTLDREPESHGFEIAEAIRRRSGNVLEVEEGSLYPALQRLMVNGWIRVEWGRTEEIAARATTTSPPRAGGSWSRSSRATVVSPALLAPSSNLPENDRPYSVPRAGNRWPWCPARSSVL